MGISLCSVDSIEWIEHEDSQIEKLTINFIPNMEKESKQSAMQELIEKLNNVKPQEFCSIETIKVWAESLLHKEKEVIEKAWLNGVDYRDAKGHASTYLEIELGEHLDRTYYNETYGGNK
jgi:hypothetical protein